MKRIFIIAFFVMLATLVSSCSKEGGTGGGGGSKSESSAEKGTVTGLQGWSIDGNFSGGSAFMYKTAQTYCFLLCKGEVNSWSKGLLQPHLEIHIWESWISDDISSLADPSKAIDINGTEKKVYVCYAPGNGQRYFDKNNYAVAANNYTFESGSLTVIKSMGMVMIGFSGMCGSGEDGKGLGGYSFVWSFTGQFKGLK